MFKKNDFVKYLGDFSTMDPIRREPDFAQIFDIIDNDSYWTVVVDLISSNKRIMCSVNNIQSISTNEEHLYRLGFKDVKNGEKTIYYIKDNFMISSIGISLPYKNYMFISGLCIGDLGHITGNIDEFLDGDEFVPAKFYKKYPSVHNLNDLITEIASLRWDYDVKFLLH